MEFEMLSYRELATRQGWKLDTARKAALRHKWEKSTSSDGTHVLMKVPTSFLRVEVEDEPTDLAAAHLEGLQVALDVERRRAVSAETDRDAWRSQALSNAAVIQKLLDRQ